MNADRAEKLLRPSRLVRPTVWYSSHGPDVEYLQRCLERAKLYSVVDGDDLGLFGAATESAVRAFQAMHGLRTNAVVDQPIWQLLDV